MSREDLNKDDFATYARFSPAALAVREAARLAAVRGLELAEPILDVGCGDGLFAKMAYPGKQVWGIDINPVEVKRAQSTASYATLICGNVCHVDLPKEFFGSAIANCSLEHVPEIGAALANVRHSLSSGAPFVLIVPTPEWSRHLAVAELLSKIGLGQVAHAYGDALDKVFNHVYLRDDRWWSDQLDAAGFETVECRTIVSRATSWIFEAFLPSSALGWLVKRVTGRWVLAPALRRPSAELSWSIIQRLYDLFPDGDAAQAAEYLIVARAREQDRG